jgi:hypothetical protein
MTGDSAGDTLIITQAGGFFQHNRFPADAGFASAADFDTTQAGVQQIPSTGFINISAGDGDDVIALGPGVDVRGLVNGEGGTDTLDYSSRSTSVVVNLGLGATGLSAALRAGQVAPPTTSAATGAAAITNYNILTRSFDINVSVSGLPPADVTGLDIHWAAVGSIGGFVVDLMPLAAIVPAGDGFTFAAAGVTLPAIAEAALLGGALYIDVHTPLLANGAIRGQLFSDSNSSVGSGTATGAAGLLGIEAVIGSAAFDSLVGSAGANTLSGGPSDDWIVGGPGNDTVNGGTGQDVLLWFDGDGADILEGGGDEDTVQVSASHADAEQFTVAPNGARLNFNRLSPNPFNLDIGTAEIVVVNGRGGNDQFSFPALESVSMLTAVRLNGFEGDDTFTYLEPRGGPLLIHLNGGDGIDALDYSAVAGSISVNLGVGTTGLTAAPGGGQVVPPTTSAAAGTVTVTNYTVSAFSRTFDIHVVVTGLAPADVTGFRLQRASPGLNGVVILDLMPLGALVPAGDGFTFTATGVSLAPVSEAAFLGGATYVNILTSAFPQGAIRGQLFSSGNVNLASGVGEGTRSLTSIENVTTAAGEDSLVGSFAANTLTAGGGQDWVVGGPGNDTLNGDAGADVLVWSNGDGTDVLEGGLDADLVQVNGSRLAGDVFEIAATGARLDFKRTGAAPFALDVGSVESLAVNGLGGADTFAVDDLREVASLTTLYVNGFEASDVVRYDPHVVGALALHVNGGADNDLLDYFFTTAAVRVNLGLGTTGLTAALGGEQESPPTASAAAGTASISNYNVLTRTFDITVTVTGLPAEDVTGFHIHQAPAGANGPIIVDFSGLPLVPAGDGFTFTAVGLTLPALSEAHFLGGATYVNVHTAEFPAGAIRGQLFSNGNVNLTSAVAAGAASVASVENVIGGPGNDSLVGSFAANLIDGAGGDDVIVPGPGADAAFGQTGSDVIVWSNGDGTDVMEGGAGVDAVVVNGSPAANDVFVVSANVPRLTFARTSPGPFTLDLADTERLIVNGLGGNDSVTVNDLTGVAALSSLLLNGFDGDDLFTFAPASSGALLFAVHGGAGTDTLQGPNALNTWEVLPPRSAAITGLAASQFVEVLAGGGSTDNFHFKGSAAPLTINGGGSSDTLYYYAGSRPVSGDTTPPDGVINSPVSAPVTFSQMEAVTIVDPQPTLSIDDVTRGESAPGSAMFSVTLSNPSLLTVAVNYATADNTATAPADYTAQGGTLTFAPGDTTGVIAVPIGVDQIAEPSETFFVNLSDAVNAAVADAQGVGTITDNTSPTITAIPNQTLAFGASTGALPFTIGDFETPPASLVVSANSSNPTLLPVANIVFGGAGAARTLVATPATNQVGVTTITVTVTDAGGSAASTSFQVTVSQPTTVQPPANLYVSSLAGNLVTFRFEPSPLGPPATGFSIEGGLTAGEVLAALPTGSDAPIFTSVVPSGSFFVRVHATRGADKSAASNEIRIHVNVPVPPSAPDHFTTAVAGNSLAFSWRNTFAGGQPTATVLDVSGTHTLQVPLGPAETFAAANVPAGTYTFQLRSVNPGGASPASTPVTVEIPAPCQGPPAVPSHVLAYRLGTTAYVVWEPPESGPAVSSYQLSVSGSFTGTFPTTGRALSGQVGPGSYTVTVAAVNACGSSPPTPPQTIVMP